MLFEFKTCTWEYEAKTKGYLEITYCSLFPYPSSLIDSKRTYNIRSVNRRLKRIIILELKGLIQTF